MKKYVLYLAVVAVFLPLGVVAAAMATPPENGPPGQGECEHGNAQKPCKDDPQPEHGKDCDEHGPYNGGVNEDHCNGTDTTPTDTTPTDTVPTVPTDTTPTTPNGPRCPPGMIPTAGKDGQSGNDECEFPKTDTTPPVTSTQPNAPTTLTSTTPSSPPAVKVPSPVKVIVHKKVKTRVVQKAKVHHKNKAIVKKQKKAAAKPDCPPNTRLYKGKCHGIVQGNG